MKLGIPQSEIRPSILELLRPWDFSITNVEDADVCIWRGSVPEVEAKAVVIPDDSPSFVSFTKRKSLSDLKKENLRQVNVSINENLTLQITPRNFYSYGMPENSDYAFAVNDSSFLKMDVVAEFYRVLNETFDVKPSARYRLFTSLPIPYTKAPKRLRDIVMANKATCSDLSYNNKLPLDALRFVLVKTIEGVTGEKMEPAKSYEKRVPCLITHDIDTLNGLNRASRVRKLEEKYGVKSAWFVPSKHFTMDLTVLEELANHGEVGAHDTKHDGKLAALHGSKLVRRIRESKRALESACNCEIVGFRAPLLQHTFDILGAVRSAGFTYDSSVPTFEPNYPRTMGPHGIGTIFPTRIFGTLEIPLTIIQDHQLLYTLGMKSKELTAIWTDTFAFIKTLGGCCVTLSHPEYKLFDNENVSAYEEFLNTIAADPKRLFVTPAQLAQEVEQSSAA